MYLLNYSGDACVHHVQAAERCMYLCHMWTNNCNEQQMYAIPLGNPSGATRLECVSYA